MQMWNVGIVMGWRACRDLQSSGSHNTTTTNTQNTRPDDRQHLLCAAAHVRAEQMPAPDAGVVEKKLLTVEETTDILFPASDDMSHHELDKFTRFFIQKSIQVIVQSRLGGDRVQTKCDARGHDWFNLSIADDREVSDRTRKCFDAIASDSQEKHLSVTSGWQVCCEVSLKNSDGESMVLEYWLFSNESLLASPRAKVSVASSDVFTVYNRLTLLLKSIIALTRATPIHKISNSGQGPDTFVICYRVFATDGPIDHLIQEKDKNRYARVIRLGTVSSPCSRITVSFSYRTNMATCNNDTSQTTAHLMPLKLDHFRTESPDESAADFSSSRKILAFASPKSEFLISVSDSGTQSNVEKMWILTVCLQSAISTHRSSYQRTHSSAYCRRNRSHRRQSTKQRKEKQSRCRPKTEKRNSPLPITQSEERSREVGAECLLVTSPLCLLKHRLPHRRKRFWAPSLTALRLGFWTAKSCRSNSTT